MGYPTKVQLIRRKHGVNQWYINFPTPIAEAMDFQKGEVVEWTVINRQKMELTRRQPVALARSVKKNGPVDRGV